MNKNPNLSDLPTDSVYKSSFRESIWILGIWTACFLYTVIYCYLNGYLTHEPHPNSTGPAITSLVGELESFNRLPASFTTPLGLGIPDWVFYGIFCPTAVAIIITIIFCLFIYSEQDLEPTDDE